jgi:RNA recognition motif-containing protein
MRRGSSMATSRESFVRLAEARTRKLIKDAELLGNLSNRSNYSYTEEDVRKIFKAVGKSVQEAEMRFKMALGSAGNKDFKLD